MMTDIFHTLQDMFRNSPVDCGGKKYYFKSRESDKSDLMKYLANREYGTSASYIYKDFISMFGPCEIFLRFDEKNPNPEIIIESLKFLNYSEIVSLKDSIDTDRGFISNSFIFASNEYRGYYFAIDLKKPQLVCCLTIDDIYDDWETCGTWVNFTSWLRIVVESCSKKIVPI